MSSPASTLDHWTSPDTNWTNTGHLTYELHTKRTRNAQIPNKTDEYGIKHLNTVLSSV